MQLAVHTREVFPHVPFIRFPGKFCVVLCCYSLIFKICVLSTSEWSIYVFLLAVSTGFHVLRYQFKILVITLVSEKEIACQ